MALGKLASISGYSIGGKTGTSEPNPNKPEEGYVSSYVAITPTSNTEIVILVTLYDPRGSNIQGGQIVGPVVGQMLSEILPYIGITSSDTGTYSNSSSNDNSLITVPDIRNKTVTEAEKILKNAGFRTNINVTGNKNELLVTDQVPKPGTTLVKNSLIVLYTTENNVRVSTTVPSLKGMTYAQAFNSLKSKNLNISSEGSGTVISQDISSDTSVEEGTVIKLKLSTDTNTE